MADEAVLVSSALDIFEEKSVLRSFVKTYEMTIYPEDGWNQGQLITFTMPKYQNRMVESDSFVLESIMSITNGDDSEPDDTTQAYAPVNGIGLTAFEYITAEVGGTLICGENRTDSYRNYTTILLGNSNEAKQTWVAQSFIWEQDTASYFSDVTKDSKNKGSILF